MRRASEFWTVVAMSVFAVATAHGCGDDEFRTEGTGGGAAGGGNGTGGGGSNSGGGGQGGSGGMVCDVLDPGVEVCGLAGMPDTTDDNCDFVEMCDGAGLNTVGVQGEPSAGGIAVATDSDGNIIVAGVEDAAFDEAADDIPSGTMFLAKYDAQGALAGWGKLNSTGAKIIPWGLAVSGDNKIVVAAEVNGEVEVSGQTVAVFDDLFVAKFEPDVTQAQLDWGVQIGEGGTVGMGQSRVAVDADENVYVAAEFGGGDVVGLGGGCADLMLASQATDVLIAKLDSTGACVWVRQLSAAVQGKASLRGLAVDPQTQDVVVTGYFSGDIDPDGDGPVLSSDGTDSPDIFLVKYSSDGTSMPFAMSFGDDGDNRPQKTVGVVVDGQSNIWLLGTFSGSLGIPDSNQTNVAASPFIAKLDKDGTHLWSAKSNGGAGRRVQGIAVDGADQVVVTGSSDGMDLFCPLMGQTDAEPADAFVVKLDRDGGCLWGRRADGPDDQIGSAITADSLGNVLVTGRYEQTISFGGQGTVPQVASGTGAFLARLRP